MASTTSAPNTMATSTPITSVTPTLLTSSITTFLSSSGINPSTNIDSTTTTSSLSSSSLSSSSSSGSSSGMSTSSPTSSSTSSSPTSSPTSSTTSSTSSSTSSTSSSSSSSSSSQSPTSQPPPTPPVTSRSTSTTSFSTTEPTLPPTVTTTTPQPSGTSGQTTPTTGSQAAITTDLGGVTTNTLSVFTSVVTSTASNGQVVTSTVTEVGGVNPTLSPDNNNSNKSSFFRNTGAVAGVFVLVGLAAASILLWILFAVRRRRRTQRLEHDTAVSATLAAAGFHRTPLDDDDDDDIDGSHRSRYGSPDVEMNQRSSSGLGVGTASSAPSGARTSAFIDSPHPDDPDVFNPYHDYVVPHNAREGHASASSPPPVAFFSNGPYRDRNGSGSAGGDHVLGHSASHSAGSYEPLLASYYRPAPSSPVSPPTGPPSPPPRNPQRLSDAGKSPLIVLPLSLPDPIMAENKVDSGASSVYSSESTGDDRLDPGLRHRRHEETDRASTRDLKDEEDYSRPVLGIRNLPDTMSQASRES